uniref:Nuclear receptor n=1 Tax=Brachionus rotundiformis TaxID=96890 RepID=A0A221CAV0_9BILA|nr:nuclear receptor [Brachionus rotundiformis]
MNLKEIKEKFCVFLNDFSRQDFGQVVEFLKFVIAEFDDDSENIYKFLKKNKNNEENQEREKENAMEIKMEDWSDYEDQSEREFLKSLVKSSYCNSNICPVCESLESKTSIYGPDVCINCRSFFKRTYPIRESLECETNGRCNCVGLRIACRKCRFKKCLSVGMRFKVGRRGRPLRAYNRWPSAPEGSICVGCEISDSTVRYHYGKLMCIKCAKWYSGCRYDVLKVKRFKCINTDPIYQNRCYELFGAELNRCSKCRYEKIISAIESKF